MPADSTVSIYSKRLDFLRKHNVNTKSPESLQKFFNDAMYSVNTKRAYINACLFEHKHDVKVHAKLSAMLEPLSEEVKTQAKSQTMTAKQQQQYTPWNEIKTLSQAYIKSAAPIANRLLVALYTELPPVRLDYLNMRLYKKPIQSKTENYFVISKSKNQLIINSYKTAAKHGPIVSDLTPILVNLVKEYFSTYASFMPYNENYLSKQIKSVFSSFLPKPITVNGLRHLYITFEFKDAPSLEEANSIAHAMGHSVSTQQTYRFIK